MLLKTGLGNSVGGITMVDLECQHCPTDISAARKHCVFHWAIEQPLATRGYYVYETYRYN